MSQMLTAARAGALFVSQIDPGDSVTREEVAAEIRRCLKEGGGGHACAMAMHGACFDDPETAQPRMKWARTTVESMFGRPQHHTHGHAALAEIHRAGGVKTRKLTVRLNPRPLVGAAP